MPLEALSGLSQDPPGGLLERAVTEKEHLLRRNACVSVQD